MLLGGLELIIGKAILTKLFAGAATKAVIGAGAKALLIKDACTAIDFIGDCLDAGDALDAGSDVVSGVSTLSGTVVDPVGVDSIADSVVDTPPENTGFVNLSPPTEVIYPPSGNDFASSGQNIYGNGPQDIHGNAPRNIHGNDPGSNIHGNPPGNVYGPFPT